MSMDLAGVLRVYDELVGAAGTMTRTSWNEVQATRATIAALAERTEQPVAWRKEVARSPEGGWVYSSTSDQRDAEPGRWSPLYDRPSGLIAALRGLVDGWLEDGGQVRPYAEQLDRLLAAHEGERA